MNHAEVTQW